MPVGSGVDTGIMQQITGLSAGALNADLVPSTYVGNYKWLSLYIGNSAYSGLLVPQVSFNPDDATSWQTIKMYPMGSLDANDVSAAGTQAQNVILGAPVIAPYFRMRMTSYTSGSAVGMLQLYTDGLPGFQMLFTNAYLSSGRAKIGFINNNGTVNTAIAAGASSDTVVLGAPGFLASVLVTTLGTNAMQVYDNASAGSGTVIGIIPASSVAGTIIACKAPCGNGITVKGNASNPAVTVFFSPS